MQVRTKALSLKHLNFIINLHSNHHKIEILPHMQFFHTYDQLTVSKFSKIQLTHIFIAFNPFQYIFNVPVNCFVLYFIQNDDTLLVGVYIIHFCIIITLLRNNNNSEFKYR